MKHKFIILVLLLVLLLLYLFFGNLTHIYIPCFFHKITGLYCPGCGLTRMLLAILKLDFKLAFRYNQLLFILFPCALFLTINYAYCLLTGKEKIIDKIPSYVWYVLVIILIIYGILRNIYLPLQPIDL